MNWKSWARRASLRSAFGGFPRAFKIERRHWTVDPPRGAHFRQTPIPAGRENFLTLRMPDCVAGDTKRAAYLYGTNGGDDVYCGNITHTATNDQLLVSGQDQRIHLATKKWS